VTERQYTLTASEELGRKGQELRGLSRDVDLLRADVAIIGTIVRMRGTPVPAESAAPCCRRSRKLTYRHLGSYVLTYD